MSSLSSLRHECMTGGPGLVTTAIYSNGLAVLMVLMIFHGCFACTEQPIGLRIVGATSTSMTAVVDPASCVECVVLWKYKTIDEPLFHNAGIEIVGKEKVIEDLKPDSLYLVSAHLMKKYGAPSVLKMESCIEGRTCPDYPKHPRSLWVEDRYSDFVTIRWIAPTSTCISDGYLVWWQVHNTTEYSSPISSEPSQCPINTTILRNMTEYECQVRPVTDHYCYSINSGLTLGTRYMFQVATVNTMGVCSAPVGIYTTTAKGYYGVGLWIFTLFGVLLLAAGVSALVIFLRRRSVLRAAERHVTFSMDDREAHIGETADSQSPSLK